MRLILAVMLMFSSYVYASCENISNDDQRNYCKAREGRGGCQNIKNDDMRNACKAQTEGTSDCGNIRDNDQRN
ncbi:hypothetical protein [Pseudomonas sp. GW460-C8]|uniref:hypothetical protein n=1 Tax=Pseudomonas sp. GW460-C8 TaxID=2070589 RepID=UPI00211429E6|nr:hypothetical protein [Pseudomonas sp. GW460-C8]